MSSFKEYRQTAVATDDVTGGSLHISPRCNVNAGEHVRLGYIGRHHCSHVEKPMHHLCSGTIVAEAVATGCYSYRIEHHRTIIAPSQHLGYNCSGRAIGNHADLDCIGTYIIEDGIKLGIYRLGTYIYV